MQNLTKNAEFKNGHNEKTNKKSQNDGMFIKFIITYQATLLLLLFWSKILNKSMIFCS